MIITQAEMERRLASSRNLAGKFTSVNRPVISEFNSLVPDPVINSDDLNPDPDDPGSPKPPDNKRKVPHDLRVIAGTLAKQGEPISDIARNLGMTDNQVVSAKNSPLTKKAIEQTLNRVRELALDKTMQALGLMSAEKFANASLKELAYVASNCARVLEKTTPRDEGNGSVVVIYAPQQKSEKDYKTLEVIQAS